MLLSQLDAATLLRATVRTATSKVQHHVTPVGYLECSYLAVAMLRIVHELPHRLLINLPTDVVALRTVGPVLNYTLYLTILRKRTQWFLNPTGLAHLRHLASSPLTTTSVVVVVVCLTPIFCSCPALARISITS